MALQRLDSWKRATEGFQQNRVGWLIVWGEFTLVSVFRRTYTLGHEGTLHTVGTAKNLARRRIDGRPGNRSRRQPVGAIFVLVGAHVILFPAVKNLGTSTAPRTGLANVVPTLPRLAPVPRAAVSEWVGQLSRVVGRGVRNLRQHSQ
jgi:hypothetical protein